MYGVREVAKLLRMPRSMINGLVKAGFVSPARGPRNALRFSFQDLIVLRTAQALATAKVSRKRITRSVKELRRHLPASMPLSGLSISAVGERVVVKEGASQWQAESGQYLLVFEGDPASGSLSVIERTAAKPAGAQRWLEVAAALEEEDPEAAEDAYRQSILAEPALLDARVNLGLLLHGSGRLAEAETVYRDAISACGEDPGLLFNLGVLLDDLGRKPDAATTYKRALAADPSFADCHQNLALLCEQLGRPRDAIRHMAEYRRLTGIKGGSPSRR
ncbi:MAG TPA: tetratricopeptide repeat protein [Burkholderiales bacterium]|nr:tetratricopeptide repeat protein [Burkholderiales bacterium]